MEEKEDKKKLEIKHCAMPDKWCLRDKKDPLCKECKFNKK